MLRTEGGDAGGAGEAGEAASAERLQAALLEREFAFDVMTHSVWRSDLLKPAGGGCWSADPVKS